MKYLFRVLLIPVFFISESIQYIDEDELYRITNEVLGYKKTIQEIEELEKMKLYPTEYEKLLEGFKTKFEAYTPDCFKRFPQNYQEMIQRFKNNIAESIAKLENGVLNGGNSRKLVEQFINNVEKSMTELERVELYPGNIEELTLYVYKNVHYLNRIASCSPKGSKYYEEKCEWHYRKMKNNEDIKCKQPEKHPFLEYGEPLVYLPVDDYPVRSIQHHVPICDCWELNNEDKKENIFVIETGRATEEFVFTLKEIKKSTIHILELRSGWEKVYDKWSRKKFY